MLPVAPDTSPAALPRVGPRSASARFLRFEALLERASDWVNPILVKEARQSLKSYQFALTFFLLLLAAWIWSLFGVAYLVTGAEYSDHGPEMLLWYYVMLCVPLLVIVPFSAFRSLVAEREDGTFELLRITNLTARQIVAGKLASAALQMLVYLSALTPCIAFTYLLRGVDVVTLGVMVFMAVVLSLGVSTAAVFLGTFSRQRHWNGILSVLIVFGLMWMFGGFMAFFVDELFRELLSAPYEDYRFWAGLAALSSVFLSYAWVLFEAAAAKLTFASENRSTRLRWTLLAQQVLLLAWATWAWYEGMNDDELLPIWACLFAVHWTGIGILVLGESEFLSQRTRRSLPRSALARVLFTWFTPGPRTGYVFVMLALSVALGMLVVLGETVHWIPNSSRGNSWYLQQLAVFRWIAPALWGYVAAYLGALNLLLVGLRRFSRVNMITSVITMAALLLAGVLAPLLFQFGVLRDFSYTILQVGNPAWTIAEIAQEIAVSQGAFGFVPGMGGLATAGGLGAPALLIFVMAVGGAFFAFNLLLAAHQMNAVWQAAPDRVRQEQAHPPTAATP